MSGGKHGSRCAWCNLRQREHVFGVFRCKPMRSPWTHVACAAALLAGSMLSASPAMAAGFWIYEMGTPDLGTASAGRAASAKDAATVFGNPAGMTKLDRSQLLVGTQLVVGDVHFNRDSGTTVAGGNGGNASGRYPARRSITRTA